MSWGRPVMRKGLEGCGVVLAQTSRPAWARDGRERLAEGRKERVGNKTGGSEGSGKGCRVLKVGLGTGKPSDGLQTSKRDLPIRFASRRGQESWACPQAMRLPVLACG